MAPKASAARNRIIPNSLSNSLLSAGTFRLFLGPIKHNAHAALRPTSLSSSSNANRSQFFSPLGHPRRAEEFPILPGRSSSPRTPPRPRPRDPGQQSRVRCLYLCGSSCFLWILSSASAAAPLTIELLSWRDFRKARPVFSDVAWLKPSKLQQHARTAGESFPRACINADSTPRGA